jgi:hypothetical protein
MKLGRVSSGAGASIRASAAITRQLESSRLIHHRDGLLRNVFAAWFFSEMNQTYQRQEGQEARQR